VGKIELNLGEVAASPGVVIKVQGVNAQTAEMPFGSFN
jgi:hypothetical protein